MLVNKLESLTQEKVIDRWIRMAIVLCNLLGLSLIVFVNPSLDLIEYQLSTSDAYP
jgi:hypothetical protein